MKLKKERMSNIEILKIISMFMIVLSHCRSFGIWSLYENGDPTYNISNLIMTLGNNLGAIGNCIFVICSAYFLLDSTKTSKEKVFNMMSDVLTISLIYLAVTPLALHFLGGSIRDEDILKSFFPIINGNNWFITCYIFLYILHPFINKAISNIKPNNYKLLIMFFYIFYCIIDNLHPVFLLYNSQLISFIIIYVSVGYFKKYKKNFMYNRKKNIALLIIFIFLLISSNVITNYLGLNFPWWKTKLILLGSILNWTVVAVSFCAFNLALSAKKFYNKTINLIGSVTLLIYLIHENILFRRYIRCLIFTRFMYKFNFGNIVGSLIYGTLIFIFSVIAALIYKKVLQDKVHKIGNIFYNAILNIFAKITDKVDNFLN